MSARRHLSRHLARRRAGPTSPEALGRCRVHLDALWILALLSIEDRTAAEGAVIEAVVAFCTDPPVSEAGTGLDWDTLAQHLERTLVLGTGSPQGLISGGKNQAIALTLAGHTSREVAVLLGVTVGQVRADISTGMRARATSSAGAERADAGTFVAPLAALTTRSRR